MASRDTITIARERLRDEQSIGYEEYVALEQFRDGVRDLPIATRGASSSPTRRADMERVFDLYRDTVMAVSHYETELGEPLAESLAAEFSPHLSVTLRKNDLLTGEIKQRLLERAQAAVNRRGVLLEVLDKEQSSLGRIATELGEIDDALQDVPTYTATACEGAELVDAWRNLQDLERRCTDLSDDRQRTLRRTRSKLLDLDEPFAFDDYLYGGLGTRHPGLKPIAETVEAIERKRTANAAPSGSA